MNNDGQNRYKPSIHLCTERTIFSQIEKYQVCLTLRISPALREPTM